MRIAIVDDLTDDIKALEHDITRWAQENNIPLVPSPALFAGGEVVTYLLLYEVEAILFLFYW